MLIVVSMVLSSMAFTLPVSAAGTELFFEDFNTTDYNSSTGTVDTTVVTKATLDGTTVDGTTVTWQAAADGTADATTQIIFEDGVLKMNKGVHGHGGQLTTVSLATGMADDTTSSGYLVFETDFMATSISAKSAWNDYDGEISFMEGNTNSPIARIVVGQTNGLQDLVGSTTNADTYAAADANAANGVNYKDNMGTAEGLENKNIKFKVVYDLKTSKSLTMATVEGETGSRVSSYGWHDVAAGGWKRIGSVSLKALAANGSTAANYQFDNIKLTKYPAADALSLTSSTVATGSEDVPLSGTIKLTFSDDIDAGSIGNIRLKKGDGTIIEPYSVAMDGTNVVDVTYGGLEELTSYTVLTSNVVLSSETGLPVVDDEITFTTLTTEEPAEVVGTVLWSDDFTGLDSTTLDALVAEDATASRGWSARIQAGGSATSYSSGGTNGGTWAKLADGSYTDPASVNKVIFGGGKATLVKSKSESHGGCNTALFGNPSFELPDSGYLVFDVDYKAISMPNKSTANLYGGDVVLYNGTETAANERAHWSLSSTSGMQDLLGYSSSTVLTDLANNMGTSTGLENKTIHVQFIYDLDNGKFITVATPLGEATRVSANGWTDFDKESFAVPTFKFDLRDSSGSGTAEVTYDNVMFRNIVDRAFTLTANSAVEDVAVDGTFGLTFSEDVSEKSLAGITLTDGENVVDCDVTLDELDAKIVHISYEGLDYATEYTVNVPLSVVAAATNLPLTAAQTITFETESETLAVTSTTPADGAEDVELDADITVAFNIAADSALLDNIKLYKGTVDEANAVALTDKTMAGDNMSVTFSHADFDYSSEYILVIPTTAGVAAEETATFTTIADPAAGTLLWSENFDGLTAANIMTARPTWSAIVGNYAGGALTSTSYNNLSDSWAAAATDYTSKLAFADGKLVLGQKRNTEHGSEYVSLTVPFDYLTTHPTTGYTILEYDYYSNAVPVRNRYNERHNVHDITLNQKSGSGRTYGVIDVTSTNGIQDMLFAGELNSADLYNTVAAGTHKENVRRADDIAGKTVHMAFIYDIENLQYNIAAQVDGEYTFLSSDWTALPTNAHAQQFFDRIIFKLNESNTGEDAWTEVSYDNFTYKAFETLPEWAIAPEPVTPMVLSTTPNGSAYDVDVDQDITITFNTAMDEASLDNIKLYKDTVDEANLIDWEKAVSADKKSVTFTHETLLNEQFYVFVVPTTVKSEEQVAMAAQATFTFTTEEFDPVIWSEDFSTLPEGVTANTSVSGWYSDGWEAHVQASGYVEGTNEFRFVDGKLQMTKAQTEASKNKGLVAPKTITGAPETGIVTLDYDYTISSKYVGDAYSPALVLLNGAGQQLLGLTFGASYTGIQVNQIKGDDEVLSGSGALSGAPVADRSFGSGSSAAYTALTDGSGTIHVRAIIDLDAKVYTLKLTKGGVEYTTPTAYFAIDPDITDVKIAQVIFQANCSTTSANYTDATVVSTFDNIVLRVADPVAITVADCSVTEGDDDVAANEEIEITFSTEVKESTLAGITLVKTEGSVPVAVTPALAGDCKTVTLSFAELDTGADYVLTVPVTVKSATGAALAAPYTVAFTTTDPAAGTLIWSENFDGLTAGREGWTVKVGNYVGGALTTNTVDGSTVTWDMAANNYTSKVAFADGKLVLGQKRNTEHGSESAQVSIPMNLDTATGRPVGTGYLILEYDYASNALPIRNRYNERNTANDLSLTESASGRTYAKIDITSTNGIQSMMDAGTINSADTYNEIAAGTYKDNVRTASDISGKTVHMALIFDVVNAQYNVAALVDGQYSFLSSDWVDYTGNQHKDWFFNKITLTQTECNTGSDEWTEVTYDNFELRQYDELPAWAIAPEEVIPEAVTVDSTSDLEDVAIDANFVVTFSKAINDDEAIDEITLMNGATPVDFAATVEGAVLTINPDADLAYETTYTLTLPNTITATDNGAFAGAEYEFTTVDAPVVVIPAPTVVSITPADNATGVEIDTDIVIEFSKAMNEGTLTNITVDNGVTLGTPSVVGNTVTFTPTDDLANGTTYTITIPATVLAADGGVFEATTYVFTTVTAPEVDPDPVTVLGTSTLTDVELDANFVVTFSKAIDDTTIDGITLMNGATPVAFAASVDGAVLTINPDADLAYETTYTVTLPNTIVAADEGAFAGAEYEFTTVEEPVVIPDPVTVLGTSALTDVELDANFVVTFSKAINDTTLAGITLKAGDLPVAFEASVDGAVLTINPDSDLANGTTYTVTLPATIVAADGGVFAGAEYEFTTVAAVLPDPTPSTGTVLWSQNFDAISALSGTALDTYMAENYSNWSAMIGTAPTQYSVTNYNLGTGFTWSEGMTKYVTADNKGGLLGFANGRVKLGIPSYMGHGSTQTKVTIPVGTLDMENVNYAVFEFDYYSDKIARRGTNQNFNDGNIHLVNSADKSIARISIGTAWGIQDIADLTTLNATTLGDAANNLGEVTSALLGKTIHFTVVFDIANNKYIVSATPEGAATTTRLNGTTPWISLPDGTTFGTISKVVMSEKDALNTSGISISEYDNLKITGYETLPYVVSSSITNGATGIETDGSIVLTFSDEIDENTIGGITFKQGANTIDIAPVADGTTVTVPYDALAGFTTYTLTVPSTVAAVNGLPVAPEYTITFTTGERIAPTPVVSEIVPADEETDVSIYSDIVITFSVPMDVDTLDDIVLKNVAGDTLTYTFAMSNNNKVMTITADEAFEPMKNYTVTIPVTVISAEDKPIAEVTTVFTTADYPITSGSVLWSENFDGLTEGRDGWSATLTDYSNGTLTHNNVNGSTVTWDMAANNYTAKVVFEDGKLKIGEKGNTEHGSAGASITIPVTLSGAHPTTGYTVFEYDYYTDAMATRNRYNEYTYHDITLAGNKTIYMLDISSTNGVQTLLGATYSGNAASYQAVVNGTHKENIRSSAGMSGKTSHIQVVFDIENLQYKIFVEVDGKISTLSDEWTALPDGVSVENFVSTLRIGQQDSNTGSSAFTMAQYDNFKYTAYDVLPQAMGTSIDGLTSVAIDSDVVVTFNGVLSELDANSITFTADGEEVEFTAELVGEGNKIKITPAEDLPYSAICEIKFADNMTTDDGYIMAGSTFEFITEPKPVSFVSTGIIFKDADGNVLASIGDETAVHVEGVFENTTDKAQTITKIIVAYDVNGKKLKSEFVTDTIPANGSKTINSDINIAGLTGVTTIKVFAIDSFANLTPMISTEVLN